MVLDVHHFKANSGTQQNWFTSSHSGSTGEFVTGGVPEGRFPVDDSVTSA
jgi:hypothetical protein